MAKILFLKILILGLLPLSAFSDPWLSAKDEFTVKKLEYLSIKNKFSLDSSSYPIPLALIRSPSEDMFNNLSSMNEYIDFANQIISKESKKFINEFGFSTNSDFNPFRFLDSKFKDKNSTFFSNSFLGDRFASKISISVIENPFEEKKYDFSDSYFAAVSGNVILGIGSYDRWWGPSHHASLILSNYSKSSPGLFIRSLDGITSSVPFFKAFGKINFSFFANQLESNRAVKNPYFLGSRISFNPLSGLTIGLTRSIMFGGEGKDNSLKALWDSIRGDASTYQGSYEHSPYLSGYRFKGSPIGAFIDGDSNYAHLSYNGEINNFTNIEFSIFYGNFNKDKDGIRNSWGTQNDDFFGIALNFDFKINSKIDAGINITSLSEELLYREKFIDKTIIGLDFKYRF